MKLIIGLGNPGDQYTGTRHNVGFAAIDKLAEHYSFDEFKKAEKFKALLIEGQIADQKVILAKPLTFMNLSGQAVQSLQAYYKIPVEDIVIVYDDIDIESGKMRIKSSGSAGTHNGMRSIVQAFGTEVPRVRIGIKPIDEFQGDLSAYVLGKFTADQKNLINEVISELPEAIEDLLKNASNE